jgi:hypothetical protein
MSDDTKAAALRAQLVVIIKEAEAQVVAARRRVQAACLLLEEESKAAALEQTATAARQRVSSSSSSSSSSVAASQLVPTSSSTYEDMVVAGLHLQAVAVLNVHQLVNIIIDSSSTNYTSWRDLMEQALQRNALIKHVTNDALSNDPGWIRMDSVVLNWISNSNSADLHQVVRECDCTACHLWLAIENQFLGNRDQHTLHLDVVFRTFVQGDLSVNEYRREFKATANGLADLGAPVEDRILVLNILRGLNQCFEHVGSIIRCYSAFLNFLKVRDDLLLEEIHMDSNGLRLPRRRSTPTMCPRRPSHRLPRRFTHPMAETAAPVATGTSTTSKTTIAVMAAATTARTATAAETVVAPLVRPPPPQVPTAGPTHRCQPTANRGRGT